MSHRDVLRVALNYPSQGSGASLFHNPMWYLCYVHETFLRTEWRTDGWWE